MLSRTRVVVGWLLAVPGAALLAAALVPLRRGDTPTYQAVLFLGLAVACALTGGLGPALGAALTGVLLLNFFFTAPLHTLVIANPADVVTLVVFVVVSIAVSSVVDSAARRRHEAIVARDEADTLAMLNRTLLGGEYDVERLLELVRETFAAAEVELVPGQDRLVLRGVEPTSAQLRILHAFGTHLGVLREREELARQTQAARELEAAARTRTALLTAVSHDLRTPLAAIRTAAETLRLARDRIGDEDRALLVSTIEEATARLSRIVADLLDMSRLQTGALEPLSRVVDVGEVAERAVQDLREEYDVVVDEALPDVMADPGLLERVLANLAANAVRHAGGVRITGRIDGPRAVIDVVDRGPGVDDAHKQVMFRPFQRLGDASTGDGVGLGLAVARGLTEAQGGTLTAHDTPGGGLTMRVELPAGGR